MFKAKQAAVQPFICIYSEGRLRAKKVIVVLTQLDTN